MEGRPLPAVLWRQASAQLTKGPTDERGGEMDRLHLSALVICGALSLGGTDLVLGAEPPAIVFVSRDLPTASDSDQRDRAIERATRGRLLVREEDRLRPLVDASDPALGPGTMLPATATTMETSTSPMRSSSSTGSSDKARLPLIRF